MRILDKSLTLFAALLGYPHGLSFFVVVGTAHVIVLKVVLFLFILWALSAQRGLGS